MRPPAVITLALFGQMNRTYAVGQAAHTRAVIAAAGRRTIVKERMALLYDSEALMRR